ncbi:MAG: hypothetical protein KBE65_02345 [Phycisphaerae bacterium]|nr:hypothetical protein [Phycisphaerae bacterium]
MPLRVTHWGCRTNHLQPPFFALACDLGQGNQDPAATQATITTQTVLDTVPVTRKRLEGGYLGPQGDFYSVMPTADRLTETHGGE